ncbi:hypothetical protein DL768_009874 [Monosporascus sp. mg162]|nr:hypothetical protein DL768_009874 [Monosporascus sp. mg162]
MKDIGKARRRSPRPVRDGDALVGPAAAVTSESDIRASRSLLNDDTDEVPGDLVVPSPRADGSLHSVVFPIKMDSDRLTLSRFMFEETQIACRPFHFPWLMMALSDPAAWHITLANAAWHRYRKCKAEESDFAPDKEVMTHYRLSLQSIARRLADPTKRNDEGLVVAIAGLICHNLRVHIEEIQRIAQTKGGLGSLHNPILRLMVSWLDLTAASYLNISPRFEIPKCLSLEIDPGNDTRCLEQLLATWDEECPDLGDIMGALRVTAAAASYVNRHINDPTHWRDGTAALRVLGPALHEILSLEGRPLPSNPGDKSYSARAAREAFRRAALVFMAAVKIRLGFEAHDMAAHLDAFRQISQLPLVDWAVMPELNLWAHVVAAAREKPEDRAWHVFTIVSIMQILGLETADRAFEVVRGVMWVDAVAEGDNDLRREIDRLASGSFGRRAQDLQAVSEGVGLAGPESSLSTECTRG